VALDSAPEYPEFRRVTLEDQAWVSTLFERYPTELSERTFASLFVWREYQDRSLVSRLDDHLMISWRREKLGRIMLPPVGANPISVIERIANPKPFEKLQFGGVIGLVEPLVSGLRAGGLHVESLRDEWDYVYLREDLVKLEGPKYHTQRKEMNKATSAKRLQYQPITKELIGQCLDLQEVWCDLKNCTMDRLSNAEDSALKEALLNFDSLGLLGGVVTVDDKVQALTIGEKLNRDTAVVHFEKANPSIRGLYQVINQQFCEHGLRGFEFVNREQDVGEPGLRRAKEGYHPDHFVEKHFLSL